MQKLLIIILVLAIFHLTPPVFAGGTNQIQGNIVTTNSSQPQPSDDDVQAAAHDVLLKLVVYVVLTGICGLIMAAFSFYGAYKAFGVKGVVGMVVVVLFVFFMIGSILIEAF